MKFIEKIIYLTLGILFATIFIHNGVSLFSSFYHSLSWLKETFITPYPEDGPALKEDDEDDAFFKQMQAEYDPNAAEEAQDKTDDLDKEVILSPEETDYIDAEDIELPEQKQVISNNKTSLLKKKKNKKKK